MEPLFNMTPKLSEKQAAEIKYLGIFTDYTYKEIATRYPVGVSQVGNICARRQWTNVEPEAPDKL